VAKKVSPNTTAENTEQVVNSLISNSLVEIPKKRGRPKKNEDNALSVDKENASKMVEKKTKKIANAIKVEQPKILKEKKIKASTDKKLTSKSLNKKATTDIAAATIVDGINSTKNHTPSKVIFQLRYKTSFGQALYITGNHASLGNNDITAAIPLNYFNDESWYVEIVINEPIKEEISYHYLLKNEDGTILHEAGADKHVPVVNTKELHIIDSWNFAGFYENAFYTEPFGKVLLKRNVTGKQPKNVAKGTHTFKVKAPLLAPNETISIIGNVDVLGNWNEAEKLNMTFQPSTVNFSVTVNLAKTSFPIIYKYVVTDVATGKLIRYEEGNNRVLFDTAAINKHTIVNDGFVVLPATNWKGAGVVIPVFSLKTNDSFGIGEFTDIKKLVDWSKLVGLKLIQVLPINDTTANYTESDSYPYSAISAFALHPIYLNVSEMATNENKSIIDGYISEKIKLNKLTAVDYPAVIKAKWDIINILYPFQKDATFASKEYKEYFNQNKHWLQPYAVFCLLRDKYKTPDFTLWEEESVFTDAILQQYCNEKSIYFDAIAIHYFVQYHLHLQLLQATNYAHQNGVVLKGDLPIGIYRHGVDAWVNPSLYNMDVQAGAPPDDFAIKGQNWGFPTYNWEKMQQDGFAWWKQRFEQMSYYFDAFRIDHILGFFRIWSIPTHAVEGIMGYFVPALPLHINELYERNINFNHHRYTTPFINDQVLWEIFGNDQETIKANYLLYDGFGGYTIRETFSTQAKVEAFFSNDVNSSDSHLQQGLFDLISNVILFEVSGSQGQQFHFRFNMQSTKSFKYLDDYAKSQLEDLYVNYFFRRQDGFWQKEAYKKLPALKQVTNMLVCGEDLGLVPACVPDVMRQLGILSLEIQRMPKDPTKQFFHPNDAPYLSVVTPSTHDMSTIRGWWEEDRSATQTFFNSELGMWGEAPYFCEDWINKAIVLQHLYSPAMWSLFQLQDLLGINAGVRAENPYEERINIPANPKHYWRYRMHLSLEQLQQEAAFNSELSGYIKASGRG